MWPVAMELSDVVWLVLMLTVLIGAAWAWARE